MADCLFCKIINKEIPADIVYEDDNLIVFKDIYPKAPVHLLAVPKTHLPTLDDLSEKDSKLITHLMLKLPEIAKSEGLDDGYRCVVNVREGGGQEIFHLHFHLLGGKGQRLPGFG